ncbi:hypothetical protein [Breznakiella homolactica]|uniref:Uncharacterized protein n=1 Tax=Breznakiella homolactica TaxID=2798577 RepID=A0A7T7XNG3_9SPIR|nr:hypothetical protein [Breznakiella homolactica]QQO09585.1 hypothetical protein JFL75_01310 [Breznakiella homolactica]
MKKIIGILAFCFLILNTLYSIDQTKYSDQPFASVPGNPAFLILRDISDNFIYSEGVWGYRLNRTSFLRLSTTSNQSLLLRQAKDNKDMVILLYQRKGQYINFDDYGRDQQGQLKYLQDIEKSYSFSVDEIILYSEILAEMPNNVKEIILSEEQKTRNEGGWKIYDTFRNEGITGAKAYAQQRAQKIEFIAAMEKAAADQEAQDAALKRAEEDKKAEEEALTRRQERDALNARNRILRTGTVHSGYKPCFGSLTEYYNLPDNFEKLAVFGYIKKSSQEILYLSGSNLSGRWVYVSISQDLWFDIGPYLNQQNQTNPCLFFISKTSSGYNVDDYILLADLLNKDVKETYLNDMSSSNIGYFADDWILNNYDK